MDNLHDPALFSPGSSGTFVAAGMGYACQQRHHRRLASSLINSGPDRLDLSDEHAKLAKEAGIKIAVNIDAHSIRELDFISAGINQVRRAWLEPADVLNTLALKGLLKRLRR